MNFKNERGITGIDTVTAIIIFALGSVAILFIYLNIYKIVSLIEANEIIIGYATEIMEEIDKEDYDNVNEHKMNQIIAGLKLSDMFQVDYTITKYQDEVANRRTETGTQGEEVSDLVKRVTVTFKYSLLESNRNYTISRVKVREL